MNDPKWDAAGWEATWPARLEGTAPMTRDGLIELLRMTLGSEERADAVLIALDEAGLAVVSKELLESIEMGCDLAQLYLRVCGEIDSGKSWEEIDHGLTEDCSHEAWAAYVRERLVLNHGSIVHAYAAGRIDKESS